MLRRTSAKVLRVLFVSFRIIVFFSADLFLLPGLALQVEKQKLSEGLEEMKTTARNSHNRAEEVITRAEEELALAKLIRRGADRDLVQAQKTIEVLTGKLAMATENWNTSWKSFRSVVDLLQTPADDGQPWAQFIPRVPTRFQEFVKRCARLCTRNVLA